MTNDDRYHTTSWDARQVQSQTGGQSRGSAAQRGGEQPKKKKKAKRRMNPLLAVVLWVVFVVAASYLLASMGWKWANDLCALNKDYLEAEIEVTDEWVDRTETLTDEDGATRTVTYYDMKKAAEELKENGLIEYPWLFRLFAWAYNGDEKITTGTFQLNSGMDYMALIRGMRSSGGSAVTVEVTIPEGYSVQQVIDLLVTNGVASQEDLTEAAANYEFQDYDFLDKDELGSIARLEGYLFPDTYDFYVGANPVYALDAMLSNFKRRVYDNEDFAALFEEAETRGYDFDAVITIASLIEKETDGSDREKIASVIYNRLENAGETAYLLQIDAALVYAAGREITQADYTALDSPYNLYLHTGLPPTAIANPGLASIKAALQPADTNYYFYVLGADGKHIFNETLAGHIASGG